ncbi:MAG: ABC transporter permease [Pseudomonadota bacterium]
MSRSDATTGEAAGPGGIRRAAILAGIAVAVIALWQAGVWASGISPFLLPGPDRVAAVLWSDRALIAENAVITMGEVLAGLALGTLLGGATALGLAAAPRVASLAMPVLVFSQAIPFFALAPILVLWFGFGVASKIAMAVLIIYFPVTSAFYDGLRRTDPGLVDLARVMGASDRRVLWVLRVPAGLPAFASGLRLATVYAPVGAVIGEWVGGAYGGLGYLMLLANGRSKIDLMFACLLVLAVFTLALYAAVDRSAQGIERWSAGRRPGADG